jgi:tripartite-type tricarboxylate transporter receptor subunit TctC
MRFYQAAFSLAVATCAFIDHGRAQDIYPSHPITLVVPYPAGGGADISARIGAPFLEKYLGQRLIIENIGGASGAIGAQKVASAKPDGYTLFYGTTNEAVIVPLVSPSTKYRLTDFAPISLVAISSAILFGRNGLPAKSLDDLIEYGRANPDALSLAHPGAGTFQYLAAVMTMKKAGLKVRYVAYRGAAPILQDIGAGHVDLAVTVLASVDQQLTAGQVVSFGLLRRERNPLRPDTPTVNESKYLKDIDAFSWTGLFAPAATPAQIVQKLNEAVRAMNSDQTTTDLRKTSLETPAAPSTPEDFAKFLKSESEKLEEIVATAVSPEVPR